MGVTFQKNVPPQKISLRNFKQRIERYFKKIEEKKIPPTVAGLSLALGFSTRTGIYDIKLTDTKRMFVNQAIMMVEKYHEEQLSLKSNPSGHIFFLKNMGWKDQKEVNHTHVNLTDLFSGKKVIESPEPKQLRKARKKKKEKIPESIRLQKDDKIIDVEIENES